MILSGDVSYTHQLGYKTRSCDAGHVITYHTAASVILWPTEGTEVEA